MQCLLLEDIIKHNGWIKCDGLFFAGKGAKKTFTNCKCKVCKENKRFISDENQHNPGLIFPIKLEKGQLYNWPVNGRGLYKVVESADDMLDDDYFCNEDGVGCCQ